MDITIHIDGLYAVIAIAILTIVPVVRAFFIR